MAKLKDIIKFVLISNKKTKQIEMIYITCITLSVVEILMRFVKVNKF